ncbi:LPXTG cell wall anchor domain-containing protein [Haladaptatus caseinilyticus]|nr:LPXTG cell wall anchor domain-containing protein [Haladaptatus caseinilyticus]
MKRQLIFVLVAALLASVFVFVRRKRKNTELNPPF